MQTSHTRPLIEGIQIRICTWKGLSKPNLWTTEVHLLMLFLFPAIQKDFSLQQFHLPNHCWLRSILLPAQKSILDAYTFWYLIKQMPLTQCTFFCPKKSDEILNSYRQSVQKNIHVTEYITSHKLKIFFFSFVQDFPGSFILEVKSLLS